MDKERLSRRDFFKFGLSVGVGGLAPSIGYLLASSTLSPIFENPPSKNTEYVERDGVYISGEDKIIEVDNHKVRVKVNALAILDSVNFLAKESGVTDHTRRFLEEHPLRIRLHQPQLPMIGGVYISQEITSNPEILLPTSYLSDYLRWQYVNNKSKLERQETVIYHELQHMVQDSIPNYLIYSKFQTLGIIGAAGAFAYQLPFLVSKIKIPNDLEARRIFEMRLGNIRRISGIVGMTAGLVLANIASPAERDAREKQIYSYSPDLAKYTGKLFSFEID